MAEILIKNPTFLFTNKIALGEMLLEKQSSKQIILDGLHGCRGNKADQRIIQRTVESLQPRLEQNNHQLVAIKQQLIKVEEENSTFKKEKYQATGECRKCRQINL